MALRTSVARAAIVSLGAGALVGAGSLAFGGRAVAAGCNDTAVKGLTITRAIGTAANGVVTAPTHALAFTGAAGAVAALLLGCGLLVLGILLVAIGRRSRGALWALLLLGGIAVVTMVGQHAASASTSLRSTTCTATKPTSGTMAPVSGTTTTTSPAGTIVPTGTTPGGTAPAGSAPDPGTPPGGTTPGGTNPVTDPGGSTPVAPVALPDASTPIALVLVGGAFGGAVFIARRRRA